MGQDLHTLLLSFVEATKERDLGRVGSFLAPSASLMIRSLDKGAASQNLQVQGKERVLDILRKKLPELSSYDLRLLQIEGSRAALEWGVKNVHCLRQPFNYTLLIEIGKDGFSRLVLMSDT